MAPIEHVASLTSPRDWVHFESWRWKYARARRGVKRLSHPTFWLRPVGRGSHLRTVGLIPLGKERLRPDTMSETECVRNHESPGAASLGRNQIRTTDKHGLSEKPSVAVT